MHIAMHVRLYSCSTSLHLHCSRSPSLLVYNLTNEGKLAACCATEMAAEICHFNFHPSSGTLWVLLGCEENPVISLEWTGNKVSL